MGAALLGAFALAACMIVPAALGYQRYVITGGSMTGTYDRGSIVFEHAVPVSDLKVGDVITYDPPPDAAISGLVTHRIQSITHPRTAHGRERAPVFRTQGDANAKPDPWQFRLPGPTQPRVAFAIPYAGWPLAALSVREVRMGLVGLPALLIAIMLLVRLWRQAGVEAELIRQARNASLPADPRQPALDVEAR